MISADPGLSTSVARAALAGRGSAIGIALLDAGVHQPVIHDADESRLATLMDLLSGRGEGRVSAGPPAPTGCDLVCNATPIGLDEGDPHPVDAALTSSMFVGDVIAGHGVTPFLQAAKIRRLQDGQRRTHGRGRARRFGGLHAAGGRFLDA